MMNDANRKRLLRTLSELFRTTTWLFRTASQLKKLIKQILQKPTCHPELDSGSPDLNFSNLGSRIPGFYPPKARIRCEAALSNSRIPSFNPPKAQITGVAGRYNCEAVRINSGGVRTNPERIRITAAKQLSRISLLLVVRCTFVFLTPRPAVFKKFFAYNLQSTTCNDFAFCILGSRISVLEAFSKPQTLYPSFCSCCLRKRRSIS